jgi:ABC-2 type transport system permease protein
MVNYLRLLAIYLRAGIMSEVQYRVNFFVQLFEALVALATGLVSLALVFTYTDTLAGWSRAELIAVMGVHILMGGVISTLIQPNMMRLMNDVQQGTLDYMLTKPEDAQLLASVREFRFWQLVDVLVGLVVLVWALQQLGAQVGWAQAAAFVAALIMGALLLYCFWLMLTTSTFWFVRIGDLLEMFQSFYQAGRWPVGIYPPWLRVSLTVLIPVAFAITVPASALTGRLTPAALSGALALTVAALLLSRWLWRAGLRRYSGASA